MQATGQEHLQPNVSQQYDVFLSYSHKDAELAEYLYTALTGRNFDLWWDRENLRRSRFWRKEVAAGLLASTTVFVIWTSNSVDSREVQKEIQFADSRGIPVLPLFMPGYDQHPDAVAVDLMFAIDQHLYAPCEGIDEALVERCVEMLRNLPGRTTATVSQSVSTSRKIQKQCLMLPALPFRTESESENLRLPLPRTPDRSIQRACAEWTRQIVNRGDWGEAAQLCEDVRHFHIFNGETISDLKSWLCCAQWYESVASNLRVDNRQAMPAELAESFNRQCRNSGLPYVSLSKCPPVFDAISEAWQRLIDLSLERAADCVRDFGPWEGSYEYALEKLECFQPDVLSGMRRVLGDSESRTVSSEPVYELFRSVLQACSPPDLHGAASLFSAQEAVHHFPMLPWPPLTPLRTLIQQGWQLRSKQQNDLRRLLAVLSDVTGQKVPAPGREAFENAVRDNLDCSLTDGWPADWDEAASQLDAWCRMITTHPAELDSDCELRQPVAQLSRVVEAVAIHLKLWLELQEARQQLTASGEASYGERFSSESAASIRRLLTATDRWLKEVVAPFMGHVADESLSEATVAETLRHTSAELTRGIEELETQLLLTQVLQALRLRDTAGAQLLLQNVQSSIPQQHDWLALCSSLQRLLNDELSLLTGRVWPPAQLPVAISALTSDALRSARDLMNDIERRVSSLKVGSHSPAQAIPWLNDAFERLHSAEVIRNLWDRLQDQLIILHFNEALESVTELAAIIPSAQDFEPIVREMSVIEQANAGLQQCFDQEDWTAVRNSLDRALSEYETLREQCTGALAILARRVIDPRLTAIRRSLAKCEAATEDESKLVTAVRLLDDGEAPSVTDSRADARYAAARKQLDQLTQKTRKVQLWKRVARLLTELNEAHVSWEEAGGIGRSNPDTGLPPSIDQIDSAQRRLEALGECADESAKALSEAISQTEVACCCSIPQAMQNVTRAAAAELDHLRTYSVVVSDVSRHVASGSDDPQLWQKSTAQIHRYLERSDHEEPAAFRLLAVHQTGVEVARILDSSFEAHEKLRLIRREDLSHPHLRSLSVKCADLEQQTRHEEEPVVHLLQLLLKTIDAAQTNRQPPDCAGSPTDWLTTPVFESLDLPRAMQSTIGECNKLLQMTQPKLSDVESSTHRLLKQAAENRVTLESVGGAIDPVQSAVTEAKGQLLPHHLIVAAFRCARRNEADLTRNVLRAVVGAGALLASCERYRKLIKQNAAWHPTAPLDGTDYQMQEQVAEMLKGQLSSLGIEWGTSSEPDSWASRWAVECEAVQACASINDKAGLRWPCGPMLAQTLGVMEKLSPFFHGDYSLRCWFGPCGVAESLRREGRADEALLMLPELGSLTEAALQARFGWPSDDDSSLTLFQQDVATCRCHLLLSLFKRDRLKDAVTVQQIERATAQFEQYVKSLGTALLDPHVPSELLDDFVEASVWLFGRFERQINEPEVHLGRDARLEDAEPRYRWMTIVIEQVQLLRDRKHATETQESQRKPGRTSSEKLATLTVALKKRRASLLFDMAVLRFRHWQMAQESDQLSDRESRGLLDVMIQTASEAVADSPDRSIAHLLKARFMVLRAAVIETTAIERDELNNYLKELTEVAAVNSWPVDDITGIRDLADRAANIDEVGLWMSKRIARDMEVDFE